MKHYFKTGDLPISRSYGNTTHLLEQGKMERRNLKRHKNDNNLLKETIPLVLFILRETSPS